MRQKCGHEWRVGDDGSPPDCWDALRNSVPSFASPPAFDPPCAARSKLQCRFSLTFETCVSARLDVSLRQLSVFGGTRSERSRRARRSRPTSICGGLWLFISLASSAKPGEVLIHA